MLKKSTLVLIWALLGFSQLAEARKTSPVYLGLKAGVMDAEGQTDAAGNAGLDLGYRFNRYFFGEVEYTDTVVDGETRNGKEWDVSTLSAFVVFRTPTPVKLKAKLGVTDVNVRHHDPENRLRDDDVSASGGVGIGFWVGGSLMELEYTRLRDNLDFISLGFNFFF